MRSSITTLFLLALSTLTTCTTLDDLNTINSDTLALTAALNTYQGGLLDALPVQTASTSLTDHLNAALAGSGVFADDAELQAALSLSRDTLAPNVEACASALVAKKGAFDAAGATDLVRATLGTIASLSSQFGQKVLNGNPSFADQGGRDAQGRIDAALSGAVSAYA